MENAGTVLSRSQILNNNWAYGFDPGTKVVDVYIGYLRKKVDEGEASPADPNLTRGRLLHWRARLSKPVFGAAPGEA